MTTSQAANLKSIAATATAVVGGIALVTKLAKDEFQHRNMKYKTNPNNVYSSIRILPDLVRFQGFIRIHRHVGDVICSVPRKVEELKPEEKTDTKLTGNEHESQTKDSNVDKMEADDVEDIKTNDDNNQNNSNQKNDNVEIKWLDPSQIEQKPDNSNSGWFDSLSNFAFSAKKSFNKLQTMIEAETIEFKSDFPPILRESAIHKNQLEAYIMDNNKFLDLFEPIPVHQTFDKTQKSNKALPLNQQWEFCAAKIHHETLFIRYAKKWITLPLNNINIKPLMLHNFDCTAFIVDYQKYFIISEPKGYVLLCQHLQDPFIDNLKTNNMECVPLEIPIQHQPCPWPYVQKYLIGYHHTNYVSLRKEQVLRRIVEKVSIAMKDDGFDNHACYNHTIQFRKCIDLIVSQIDGADKALQFKQNKINKTGESELSDEDNDISMSSNLELENAKDEGMENEADEKKEESKVSEGTAEFLPYLNLLNDAYHGLNVEHLTELDWKLTAEASWLANYVYGIHEPQQHALPSMKRRSESWSNFTSYMPFASNSSLLNMDNMHQTDENNNMDTDDIEIDYRGPPQLAQDISWQKHSNKHFQNLSKFGFELLDYAITRSGQSVQFLIARSYDNPSTIFLVFKGTSNPLDAMVNIGLHPLELPHFQCSVFSGMYASLQESLALICRKLNIYGSEEYCKYNPCPPDDKNNITSIYRLICCGHSLGGGYAQLFLAHLLSANEFSDYFEKIKCITFGAPLVFCKNVFNSFLYNKLNERCLNFVYEFDLVPRLQNGMDRVYRSKLLQGLLISQLPVSNIGLVFDINQRLNYVLNLFQKHQWLLDRYSPIGKYIILFEKNEPRSIDKKNKCFTKSAKSNHLCLDANKVLTMTSMLDKNEQIYAVQVLKDHKMLNYMKTIMFQQF